MVSCTYLGDYLFVELKLKLVLLQILTSFSIKTERLVVHCVLFIVEVIDTDGEEDGVIPLGPQYWGVSCAGGRGK